MNKLVVIKSVNIDTNTIQYYLCGFPDDALTNYVSYKYFYDCYKNTNLMEIDENQARVYLNNFRNWNVEIYPMTICFVANKIQSVRTGPLFKVTYKGEYKIFTDRKEAFTFITFLPKENGLVSVKFEEIDFE